MNDEEKQAAAEAGLNVPKEISLQASVNAEHGMPFVQMRVYDGDEKPHDTYLAADDAETLGVSLIRLAAGSLYSNSIDTYIKLCMERGDALGAEAVMGYRQWFVMRPEESPLEP